MSAKQLSGIQLDLSCATIHELCSGVARLPDYRLYFLDKNDHIRRRIDLDCRDDAHATEVAAEHMDGNARELWDGARLVRRFEPPLDG